MNIPTWEKLSAFSPHMKGKVKACIPQYNTGWRLADSGIKQAPPSLGSQDEYSQPVSTLASLAGGGDEGVAIGKNLRDTASRPPASSFRGAQPQETPLQLKVHQKAMLRKATQCLSAEGL